LFPERIRTGVKGQPRCLMLELDPACFLKESEPGLKVIPDASCWNWLLFPERIWTGVKGHPKMPHAGIGSRLIPERIWTGVKGHPRCLMLELAPNCFLKESEPGLKVIPKMPRAGIGSQFFPERILDASCWMRDCYSSCSCYDVRVRR
jgi:hypothetical protein